ncbi:MAG: MBL fold metallo-hydrolase [Saccharofermentanales bacterium]
MKKYNKIFIYILLLILLFTGCTKPEHTETKESSDIETGESSDLKTNINITENETRSETTQIEKTQTTQTTTTIAATEETEPEHLEKMEVHFLDVGQGESILIKYGGYNMLIDGGTMDQSCHAYLQDQNIDYIDYVIATHPHEDHIGGLIDVVDKIEIDTIIMPNVTHTSVLFDNFITYAAFSEAEVLQPHAGDKYDFGDASFTIIAPNSDYYEDLNNYSIVLKLEHGQNSFLFTGDIEALSESEIINSKQDITADVLKVAHHGSNTSTSDQFIKLVAPSSAMISCAKDNAYGYPDLEVLQRLIDNNVNIYRTDLQGTVILLSDGKNITFSQDPNNELIAGTLPTTEVVQTTSEVVQTETTQVESYNEPQITNNITAGQTTAESAIEQITETITQTTVPPPAVLPTETPTTQPVTAPYIGNSNTGKFHHSYCSSVDQMNPANKVPIFDRNLAIDQGYVPCKRCNP